ncbi:aldo/keto reductase [Priestia megaterium]|jgi:diketogulonate reductase-like aldo/keto reductase|uniref:aldo/keto reductase n=1 Tax=Priestia megaterium TaxID=1404 RepID=UPI0021C0955F|nr:aldo/keto reductase [Priestia megaterium]MCT9852201.1 aldo/keto reductase [Priestia megaterium]MDF1964133.1 aldo/keto reductase [Priestia megaterium]
MKKVKIAGREVFPIGLGTWSMGDDKEKYTQELNAVRSGLEAGIQVIDTAEMYGDGNSESLVGDAIKPFAREKLYLVSKVLPNNASKKQLPISLDSSLKRLKTDYLDLYLLHWQGRIPIEETIEAMEKAKIQGKIKAWGVSNFDVTNMTKLLKQPKGHHCVTNQVRYNLGDRGIDFDLVPMMKEHNMPLMAYAPVARGDRLGSNLTKQKVLLDISKKYNADIFQILLAWCIRNGQTIAIPQSSNPKHVISNVKSANIQLTEEDLVKIDSLYPEPRVSEPLALW